MDLAAFMHRPACRHLRRYSEGFDRMCLRDGRHVGTRTPDLYRVNFVVQTLKPFSFLAFPFSASAKRNKKQPSFGDELVTSLGSPEGQ
jgi:hypothetical protein